MRRIRFRVALCLALHRGVSEQTRSNQTSPPPSSYPTTVLHHSGYPSQSPTSGIMDELSTTIPSLYPTTHSFPSERPSRRPSFVPSVAIRPSTESPSEYTRRCTSSSPCSAQPSTPPPFPIRLGMSNAAACSNNMDWIRVYGISSGYIVWVSSQLIIWFGILSIELIRIPEMNQRVIIICVSMTAIIRLVAIVWTTKYFNYESYSCSELSFVESMTNSSATYTNTLLLAADALVYALIAVLAWTILSTNEMFRYNHIIKALLLLAYAFLPLPIVFFLAGGQFTNPLIQLQFLVRFSQLFFGLLMIISQIIFSYSAYHFNGLPQKVVIERVLFSSLAVLYIITFSSDIYTSPIASFILYSFLSRILEIIVVIFSLYGSDNVEQSPDLDSSETDNILHECHQDIQRDVQTGSIHSHQLRSPRLLISTDKNGSTIHHKEEVDVESVQSGAGYVAGDDVSLAAGSRRGDATPDTLNVRSRNRR